MDPPRRRQVNRAETYKKWVKLHLADITASLASYNEYAPESIFFYDGQHPIRWVYIVGTVIGVEEQERRMVFTIDDGSGQTMNAVAQRHATTNTVNGVKNVPKLHSTVKVKGQLELYHGAWQLKLLELETDLSLEAQVKFWKEANETHDRLSSSAVSSTSSNSKKRKN
ncbi:hypothetical protein TWF694_006272 [Orbilia ellipsospora]|uniref:CST complex subunit Stn1 N-terminal domain-containing protein n=1 Tax=Orbilia ellipsospora TaxID=2528407 RepID=A0AAV9XJQ4_9PEZI